MHCLKPWLHYRIESPYRCIPLHFCHFNATVDVNGEQRPPCKCDMTPYTAVTATVADTETSFETYSRTVLFNDTVAVSLGCQMTTEKLENMFCSLKTANFIWPALHIWHVFLQWPFRIVKIKYAVFRQRKITVFHCSAMLIWQVSCRAPAEGGGGPGSSSPGTWTILAVVSKIQ